jgi:hypothetical protein
MAKSINGMANANANPNIPIAGPRYDPLIATSTKSVPMIGPVQENETNTNVNAINKILIIPEVDSALLSNPVVHEAGNVNSKAPKKEIANNTKSVKKKRLKKAFVERLFKALAPKINVIKTPKVK